MAVRKLYSAGFGPTLWEDTDLIEDQDGDFPGATHKAVVTDGEVQITTLANKLVGGDAEGVIQVKDLVDFIAGVARQVVIADNGAGGVTVGNPLTWDDLPVPFTSIKTGGVKDPGFDVILDGLRSYAFSHNTEEEVFFSTQLLHGYEAGSDLEPHVHWLPVNADTGTVRWGLEYAWVNRGSVVPSSTTIYSEVATPGVAFQHISSPFPRISGTGKTKSSMLICRFFRDAGHANDTYGSDASVLEFDFHFLKKDHGMLTLYPGPTTAPTTPAP